MICDLSLKIFYCTALKSMETPGKGLTHAPGGREWGSDRLHHATQNIAQFKTHKLFTSGIFHLMFWHVTKTPESETMNKGGATVVLFQLKL